MNSKKQIPKIKNIVKRIGFDLFLYFNTDEFRLINLKTFVLQNPDILHAKELTKPEIVKSVFTDGALKFKKLPVKKKIGHLQINDFYSIGGDTIYQYSTVWYPSIDELILFVRQKNNFTQKQLAHKLNVPVSKISNIENHKSSITANMIKTLTTLF